MDLKEYKKIALSLLAQFPAEKKSVIFIGITSSDDDVDTYDVALNVAYAFSSMEIPVTVISANIKDDTNVALSDSFESFPLVKERSFRQARGAALTPASAISSVSVVDTPICLFSLDSIALHSTAMYFAACCDGLVFAEKYKISRLDKIETALDTAASLNVKPIGFVTLR